MAGGVDCTVAAAGSSASSAGPAGARPFARRLAPPAVPQPTVSGCDRHRAGLPTLVIVMHEPTTTLDIIVRRSVLTEIARPRDHGGVSLVHVSGDRAAVSRIAVLLRLCALATSWSRHHPNRRNALVPADHSR